MPLSKWCQLTRDANVGRNAEKRDPTFITWRGEGARKLSSPSQGRKGESEAHCSAGLFRSWLIPQCKYKCTDTKNVHFKKTFSADLCIYGLSEWRMWLRFCSVITAKNPIRLFKTITLYFSPVIKRLRKIEKGSTTQLTIMSGKPNKLLLVSNIGFFLKKRGRERIARPLSCEMIYGVKKKKSPFFFKSN